MHLTDHDMKNPIRYDAGVEWFQEGLEAPIQCGGSQEPIQGIQ